MLKSIEGRLAEAKLALTGLNRMEGPVREVIG